MLSSITRFFGLHGRRKAAKCSPFKQARLCLECLEERDVPAIMANMVWIGNSMVELKWSTDANWQGNLAPGANDIATFDENAVNNCVIDSDVSVAGVVIATTFGNRKITLTDTNVDLTLSESLYMDAGELIGGDVTVSGGTFEWWGGKRIGTHAYNDLTTISANAVLNIRGNAELNNTTLNNYGTINVDYLELPEEFTFKMLVDARLVNKDGSFFNNLPDSQELMTIHSDASYTEFAIESGAMFSQSGPNLSIETSLFNSAGTIELYENTNVVAFGEGTLGGYVCLGADSNLIIAPYGNLTFVLDNVTVIGEGNFAYVDGSYDSRLELQGSNTIQNFRQTGGHGNLAGTGILNITGEFNWIGGGTWTGNVTVNIEADAVLNIVQVEGGTTFYLWNESYLSNSGTVNWESGSIVSGSDSQPDVASTRINNAEGAVFDIQGDLTLTSQFEPRAFVNQGTVKKSQGNGVASVDLELVGGGTLDVTSGTLVFVQ